MATKKKPASELEQLVSTVKLKLLDPFGNVIDGLKYQICRGGKIITHGVTDGQGQIQQFASHLGKELSIQVEHFTTGAMTQIHQLTPWNEKMSLKLVSGKVKYKTQLAQDKGSPGDYRRKTHTVVSRDTLSAIATKNATTAQAMATLNAIAVESVLKIGQVLKVSSGKSSAAEHSPAPAQSGKKTSTQTVQVQASESSAGSVTTTPVVAPTTSTPTPVAVPANVPPATQMNDARGENGSPKTTITLQCNQQACIKLGDKGQIVEELNIRLMGFGNTISAPTALNEFTAKTERAVKQFQRDYMGVSETGKVCGAFLKALDDFRSKYPLSLNEMKCTCGKCEGFGTGKTDSAHTGLLNAKTKDAYPGVEHPGMHKGLLWSMRAVLFYVAGKDKDLNFRFLTASSGYRCWYDNKKHVRTSTNHMGKALDLQFLRGTSKRRCEGNDIDVLREKVFIARMGAQLNWDLRNRLSLEPAKFSNGKSGATSWVHVDVRSLSSSYLDNRYFATHQAAADGDPMLEMAKREGRLGLLACGGLQPAITQPTSASSDRVPASSLSISKMGLDFIKGWEKLELKPYDDSHGYCTIGWGHLVGGKQPCKSLVNDPEYEQIKGGITEAQAADVLKRDLFSAEQNIRQSVQKPLLQQEYDALVSLIFNIGSFRKCPKLLSKLNTADYIGACDEFTDITNGGEGGLVKRRNAEINIFRNNVYDSRH
jgi:GH24 family phage-related lysozyme (muramidase)/LysM repeat protein